MLQASNVPPSESWELFRTDECGQWTESRTFDSIAAVARCIIEIEALDTQTLTLQVPVSVNAQEFPVLEYKGRHALYIIRRQPAAQ